MRNWVTTEAKLISIYIPTTQWKVQLSILIINNYNIGLMIRWQLVFLLILVCSGCSNFVQFSLHFPLFISFFSKNSPWDAIMNFAPVFNEFFVWKTHERWANLLWKLNKKIMEFPTWAYGNFHNTFLLTSFRVKVY